MGFFKKQKKDGAMDEAQLSGRAQKLADQLLVVQSRWAAQLNAQAQKIGNTKTKILLAALLLGFGCYCLWLVASAFI